MASLVIIGNGFDLHHGLKTAYCAFHDFVKQNYSELADELDSYFELGYDKNYLWKDFENDLATFNWRLFFDDYNFTNPMSESFKISELYGLNDELSERAEQLIDSIRDVFQEWIYDLEYPDMIFNNQRLQIEYSNKFISFNYTNTLERYYGISKKDLLYIHGNAYASDELIFGHGVKEIDDPKPPDFDEFGNPNRTMYTDPEDNCRSVFYRFQKDTNSILKLHKSFFDDLRKLDSIIVLGHSLGKVDWPYFIYLREQFPNATWTISYYNKDEIHSYNQIGKEILKLKDGNLLLSKIDDLQVV